MKGLADPAEIKAARDSAGSVYHQYSPAEIRFGNDLLDWAVAHDSADEGREAVQKKEAARELLARQYSELPPASQGRAMVIGATLARDRGLDFPALLDRASVRSGMETTFQAPRGGLRLQGAPVRQILESAGVTQVVQRTRTATDLVSASLMAGTTSYSATLAQEASLGTPLEEARQKAPRAGSNTALIAGIFGVGALGGIERAAAGRAVDVKLGDVLQFARKEGLSTLAKSDQLRTFAREAILSAGGQATQGAIDTLITTFENAGPETNLSDAWQGALESGKMGGYLGLATHVLVPGDHGPAGEREHTASSSLIAGDHAPVSAPDFVVHARNVAENLPPAGPDGLPVPSVPLAGKWPRTGIAYVPDGAPPEAISQAHATATERNFRRADPNATTEERRPHRRAPPRPSRRSSAA